MADAPPERPRAATSWLRRGFLLLLVVAALVAVRLTLFAPPPLSVRVARVARGVVEETVSNSRAGTVTARRRAKLSPEVGGMVVALPHREGARVRAGDVLLRIDDALYRARTELAERETAAASAQREAACLAAERARREQARVAPLARDGVVSSDLFDQVDSQARTSEAACRAAQAAEARAQAAVGLARAEMAKTVLRSPFDGVLAEVGIEVGEWTTPSPPVLPVPAVLDVIDAASVYVSAPMDEVDSARIRPGLPARVTVDSHPGRSFPAKVRRVAPFVLDRVEQNRTVEIEVDLADPRAAAELLPGTSADAEVVLSERASVLRIPSGALMEGGRVLVLERGRLRERPVRLGLRNWDFAEVAAGLGEGEEVVVSLDRPEVKAGARARVEGGSP
jgi:HlyD family secretion protein